MTARVLRPLTLVVLSGCASSEMVIHQDQMRGFPAGEARATARSVVVDDCALRTGVLVLEIELGVVREWPHEPGGSLEKKKQPLVLTELSGPGTGTGSVEVVPLVAPEGYLAGEPLQWFAGKRILARTVRSLAGKTLTVTLAKNNRTGEPLWEPYAHTAATATAGAVSATGVSVSSGMFDAAFEIVRHLTPDDRVLVYSTPVEPLLTQLGAPPARKAAHLTLTTSRSTNGAPSAEMAVTAFVEPEPGCP